MTVYYSCQVGKAVNQTRQFTEEIRGLFKWMTDANDFLKDQEPAAGDPETLEAQLDQSEVSWFCYLTPHRPMVPKGYHHLISPHNTHTLSSSQVLTCEKRAAFHGDTTVSREMTSYPPGKLFAYNDACYLFRVRYNRN